MEFSAAKSVGNSKKYICLSMKNRSNITEPAAHSSIMSSKQLLQAHKCMFHCLCVYLCICMYICIRPRVCTCVCIFMHVNVCVLWLCCDSYLDVFVIFFHQDTPFPIPKQPMGMCPFFAEVRNRTLASMWFELGPPKLWRTPRMTWGTCRPNSILLNGGEKSSPESSEIFWLRPASD